MIRYLQRRERVGGGRSGHSNAGCFKILISARSMIRYLQRRVSISNSRECKVVHDWRSGHSLCCFDLSYHALSTLIAQNINLIKVYDSISSSISSTQSEYEKQSRIGTSLLSQVHPMLESGRRCYLKFTQCSLWYVLWCVEFDTDSIFCECCFILFKTCRFFTTMIQLDWIDK
jgi:hypothetical protein